MSESGEDYDPGPWAGYDFASARAAYNPPDPTAGRGYGGSYSVGSKATSADALPPKVSTKAKAPLVIITDGTGSMGQFPEIIFEKLPLLDDGVKDYLGKDCEISYAMIGDVGDTTPPLQVRPFGSGKQMIDSLNKLVIGKGGGGNLCESYELGAIYYARNSDMPNAVNPVLIYICDEGLYPTVDANWAQQYAGVALGKSEPITIDKLFGELKSKYSVYCIRKAYDSGSTEIGIHKQWTDLIGADRIAMLDEPRRVVDVILGLLAHEVDKVDFFNKEIKDRQTPDQVASVKKAMTTIGRGHKAARTGKSVMKRPDDGKTKNSGSLI